jgi:hypothetical protein
MAISQSVSSETPKGTPTLPNQRWTNISPDTSHMRHLSLSGFRDNRHGAERVGGNGTGKCHSEVAVSKRKARA